MDNMFCPEFDPKSVKCQNCENKELNKQIMLRMIILECKSFYRTFLDIEPHMLFCKDKSSAGFYSEEEIKEDILYEYSFVVNGAFATELAIKYILTFADIDFHKGEKGHNLLYLYKLLLLDKKSIKNDREAIISKLCEDGSQSPETIIQNIETFQDCYNKYRYSFSCSTAGYNFFFRILVHTICDYAIKKSDLQPKEEDIIEIQLQNTAVPD